MKNIAIFGGSFNPPHLGHQMMLMHLAYSYSFDEIWVNPVHTHYFAKDQYLIQPEERLHMAKLAFEKIAKEIKIKPIDIENGFSKSYDMLSYLKETTKGINFTLVLGEDNYQSRKKWYRFDAIEAMVDILYLGRMGVESELELPFQFPSISSSEIRQDLAKNKYLLDKEVYDYITKNQLYHL